MYISTYFAYAYDQLKINNIERGKFVAFFNILIQKIKNEPIAILYSESTLKFMFFSLILVALIYIYQMLENKKFITGKEYGSSRWAELSEIKHLEQTNVFKKNKELLKSENEKRRYSNFGEVNPSKLNKIFSQNIRISTVNWKLNNNTLFIGGSGSGKTRGFIVPNILQANSNYVITDPKGEILSKTGSFLEKNGYKIKVLNLENKLNSNCYNPFYYIHVDRDGWEDRVISLINTIIINTNGDKNGNASDPFWEKAEILFLQSLFFLTLQAFPEEEQNMNTVMELIAMLQMAEEGDERDSELDQFFDFFALKNGSNNIAVQTFNEFRSKAPGKTALSVVISVIARLSPFKISSVQRIFEKDELELDKIGEEKTAFFVAVPPTDDTYNFIAGMVFTQLFQEMQYLAGTKYRKIGERLPIPCQFLLDEFANTCKIPKFLEILSYARSFGVGISIGIQSMSQIKKMYEKNWGQIIDNCDTILYLGKIKHTEDLKYYSELLGKGTYDKKSRGKSYGKQKSTSTNEDKFGRELLTPAELAQIPDEECVVIISGFNPFYDKKYNLKNHSNYKMTSDFDHNLSYCFEDINRDDLSEENDNETVYEVTSPIIEELEQKQNYDDYEIELEEGFTQEREEGKEEIYPDNSGDKTIDTNLDWYQINEEDNEVMQLM